MSIFEKARANLNLTPGERAALKLVQSFINVGIAAVLLALPMWLAAQDGKPLLTWTGAGAIAGVFIHGFMSAWQKYTSAKGDAPLATAIGAVDTAISHALTPDPAAPIVVPDPVASPAPASTASN